MNSKTTVYRGDPELLHIPDGKRGEFGEEIAALVTTRMQQMNDGRTDPLCPGCYMVALMAAGITLAKENGQNVQELQESVENAFRSLTTLNDTLPEEIQVIQGT